MTKSRINVFKYRYIVELAIVIFWTTFSVESDHLVQFRTGEKFTIIVNSLVNITKQTFFVANLIKKNILK